MVCLNTLLLLLLSSAVSIDAGYDQSSVNQGFFYPIQVGPRMTYTGSGMNGMMSYVTTGNAGQDLKAYASQPQEYTSANYVSSGHSNGFQAETSAAVAPPTGAVNADQSSVNGHNTAAGYAAAAGNNVYGANSEQFLPAYANGGYEDNHLSSAATDYSNAAGYSLGNEYHSNIYDKFQPNVHTSNSMSGQYFHGSQTAGRMVIPGGGMYDASAIGNILAHYGVTQIQPQFIHGKTDAIPVSKHIQVTRHIPVPIYKQIHIPYQKPVKVQIPHPILVPVPHPYPIQVPFSKPYAVPMVQEITIPIEKIVPYAVEKKIPYPIEKHVPYPVEKHVPVPVSHPYPVKVPVVKTVLHKVKTHGWN